MKTKTHFETSAETSIIIYIDRYIKCEIASSSIEYAFHMSEVTQFGNLQVVFMNTSLNYVKFYLFSSKLLS